MSKENLYVTKCESCGEAIHSHRFDEGYGEHSYEHKTLKPYEDKRINLPEREGSLRLEICLECIEKDPSCHKVIKKKRLEWFDDEIRMKIKDIENTEKQIQELTKEIPEMKKEVWHLKSKRKKVLMDE